ncbi:hypothetical protein A1Q1_03769 [Trichosporon asahii var. asahii CBS 2479]|uniref:DUF1996 domain-containing protein n=1 Tax=Trichosporon asahii var. asahii (strain ATCC 90039 / CBS 2479 / JCM 2466 / KCTC 7840 / NBRC 103889/ NCYC 2677 / UAMH 7654) TaxID=1186058 RepID=J5RGF3_TRIAS|nr:hypothetical protein A1Q1_03769 [Trichosporon asahii var. asahii CBS 2479]EJT52488.1 hypothetical protein A1Q1_03769 [Trichosporon asahii var. asahii CBS 2479]
MFKAAILGALLAAAGVSAVDNQGEVSFVLGDTSTLLYSRMDPLVNPGEVSGHMHQILGASNFRDVLSTPDEMQRAHCSSTKVQADKSNYWTPTLYFMWPNGTYTPLTSGTRIYYDLRPSDGGQKVTPFPKGLRMLSGLAMFRDEGAEQSQGVRISYNRDPNPTPKFMPRKYAKAPNQVIMSIFFPRCGLPDQRLDSEDHFSHMAHPVSGNLNEYNVASDKCPDTHPIMYPKVLIETLFELTDEMKKQWNPNDSNFILSNGDVTGVTYHGDFINGWDTDVLQAVIDQDCRVGDSLEKCHAFDGLLDKDTRFQCRYQGQILDEDIGFLKPLSSLPGCNPKWNWEDGPAKPTNCPENKPKPGYVNPQYQLNFFYRQHIPISMQGSGVDPTTIGLGDCASASRGYGCNVTPWGTMDIQNSNEIKPVDQPMQINAPASAEMPADLPMELGTAEHPTVNGMFDTTEFRGLTADRPVDLAQATKGAGDGHYEAENACERQAKLLLPCGQFQRKVGIFGNSTEFRTGGGEDKPVDTGAKAKAATSSAASGFNALPTGNTADSPASTEPNLGNNFIADNDATLYNADAPMDLEPDAPDSSASVSGSASASGSVSPSASASASASGSAAASASGSAASGSASVSSVAPSGSASAAPSASGSSASSAINSSEPTASSAASSAVYSGGPTSASSASAAPQKTGKKGKKCRAGAKKHRRSRLRLASH